MTALPTTTALPCQSGSPERFFPSKATPASWVAAVKAGCAPCPVRDACREYALRHSVEGIWAATDEQERKALRKVAGIVAKPIVTVPYPARGIAHGTEPGAKAHVRRGEKPCHACREAANRARVDRQARRAAS